MNAEYETQVVDIDELQLGDLLVNLGRILEIEERGNYYFLVIDRMNERQVWKFNKTDKLVVVGKI